jgi:phage-related protein
MIQPALEKMGEAVREIFTYIKENWQLLATLGGIIGGIATAIGLYNAVAAIKAAMAAAEVTTVWGLVAAYAAQAAAMIVAIAPYVLIVAAIAAVIAIIVLCVKYWDEIVAAVKKAAEAIWNAIKAAWDWIAYLFSNIASWFYDHIIKPIAEFFVGLWEGIVSAYHTVIDPWIEIFTRIAAIVDEKIIQPIKNFFAQLWSDIKSIFSAVGSWFNEKIIQPVTSAFTKIWQKIKDGAAAAWEGIKKPFSAVATWFKDIFSKAWQAVKNVFSTGGKIFDGIKEGIVSAFKTVVNAIIRGINKVISVPFNAINSVLKKIKSIEIVGVKPFSWVSTFSVPKIPELEKGGVLKKGQIGLLEGNGAEAVVPLEKNTEWITKVAEMLGGRMGGTNRPIYLMLDKKVLAEGTVEGINDITRLTGNLPLVLA